MTFLCFLWGLSSLTFFFVGPENAPCFIYPLTLLCCRAICNKNDLNSYAICVRNPAARGPNEHIFGPHKNGPLPPANLISIFTHSLIPPSPSRPIALLQQLPALFQRFPSSHELNILTICCSNPMRSHWKTSIEDFPIEHLHWSKIFPSRFRWNPHEHLKKTPSGWWFGSCFILPYIGNVIIPTDQERGRSTTNQLSLVARSSERLKDSTVSSWRRSRAWLSRWVPWSPGLWWRRPLRTCRWAKGAIDGDCIIRWMEEILHQLIGGKHPIILFGLQPSQVVQDFLHPQNPQYE